MACCCIHRSCSQIEVKFRFRSLAASYVKRPANKSQQYKTCHLGQLKSCFEDGSRLPLAGEAKTVAHPNLPSPHGRKLDAYAGEVVNVPLMKLAGLGVTRATRFSQRTATRFFVKKSLCCVATSTWASILSRITVVRMIQRREYPSFAIKSGDTFCISRESFG